MSTSSLRWRKREVSSSTPTNHISDVSSSTPTNHISDVSSSTKTSTNHISDAPSSTKTSTNLNSFFPRKESFTPKFKPDLTSWRPSTGIAFRILLGARILGAIFAPIPDCDEVFNFWEPNHFLLYGKGLQPWEYSPMYALRSYAYILPHQWIGKLVAMIVGSDKVQVFYLIRVSLAIFAALCETCLYDGIRHRFRSFPVSWYLILSVSSAGLFHASVAFLPSTFAMNSVALFFGAWFKGYTSISLFIASISVWVGWPFVGLAFIPTGIAMLKEGTSRLSLKRFISNMFYIAGQVLLYSVMILAVQTAIDSHFYGKLVSPPLRILAYNMLYSGGAGGGSELYGTEDFKFYFRNLFLNFNFQVIFAMIAIFISFVMFTRFTRTTENVACMTVAATATLWIGFLSTRPHKEERFMFPIYHLLNLLSAMGLYYIQRVVTQIYILCNISGRVTRYFSVTVMICISILNVSRIYSQYQYYGAPIKAWTFVNQFTRGETIQLNTELQQLKSHIPNLPEFLSTNNFNNSIIKQDGTTTQICVAKEWYRFPSSFFLPGTVLHKIGNTVYKEPLELRFLRSGFRGQLPQPFNESLGTTFQQENFNDENKEESVNRYTTTNQCDIIVDLRLPDSRYDPKVELTEDHKQCLIHPPPLAEEPWFRNSSQWISIFQVPFLDGASTSTFRRAFYVPFFEPSKQAFGTYHVLVQRKPPTTA